MLVPTSALASGGVVLFSGGTNPARAGLVGALLSRLIDKFTNSKFSHVAVLPPAQYWPTPTSPSIIESTIWLGVSGPQSNSLLSRLQADYASKGGHATYLPFLPQFAPDWKEVGIAAAQMFVLRKQGKLHYSVKHLFADAVDRNPVFAALPISGVLTQLGEHDRGLVCSECAGLLLQAGGVDKKCAAAGVPWLPNVLPIPGQPIGCAPEDIHEMPIWGGPIALL